MNTTFIKLITLITAAALIAIILSCILFAVVFLAAPINQTTTAIIAGSVYALGFFGVVFCLCVLILIKDQLKERAI